MGTAIPKQYLSLAGKPVIHHTLDRLCRCPVFTGIVVGIGEDDQWWAESGYANVKLVGSYAGGAQRAHTVLNGLRYLCDFAGANPDDWVAVHDAVRPLVRCSDIEELLQQARRNGYGVILGVAVVDTLKTLGKDALITGTSERKRLFRAMTPQVFKLGELATALSKSIEDGRNVTDESMAMEKPDRFPAAVVGSAMNIKLTVPQDLELIRMGLEHAS